MPSPARTFARLLICVGAVAGLLAAAGAVAVVLGWTAALRGLRAHWCIAAPASFVDWAIHSSTFGAWLVPLFPLLIAAWVAKRERAVAVALRAAAQTARQGSFPPGVAAAAETVGIVDAIDVVDAPRPFAFVYGWATPRICVSTGLVARLSEREIEAVLRHEQWHLIRRDPVRLLAVRMLAAGFVFLPPIHRLVCQYRLATEIAADQHAVTTMGTRRWLAGALSKLVVVDTPPGAVAFLGLTEARIAALAGDVPPDADRPHRIAAFALVGELAIITAAVTERGDGFSLGSWLPPFC